MSNYQLFEILSEGKSNSLGRAIEVYEGLIAGNILTNDVYELYKFEDSVIPIKIL